MTSVAILSGCNTGGSDAYPWYANGYVLKSSLSYSASGELESSETCVWVAERRQLTCTDIEQGGPSGWGTVTTYNEAGRRERDVEGGIYSKAYEYVGGKLTKVTESNLSSGDVYQTTQLRWQGNRLVSYSTFDDFDLEEYTTAVEWENGRIESLQSAEPSESYGMDRLLYDYTPNGQLSAWYFEERDSQSDNWIRDEEQIEFYFDADGNIEGTVFSGEEEEYNSRSVHEWQYIGEPIENKSLTISKLVY